MKARAPSFPRVVMTSGTVARRSSGPPASMDEVTRLTADLPDYQARRAMYEFISRPDLDPRQIARQLSMGRKMVRSM